MKAIIANFHTEERGSVYIIVASPTLDTNDVFISVEHYMDEPSMISYKMLNKPTIKKLIDTLSMNYLAERGCSSRSEFFTDFYEYGVDYIDSISTGNQIKGLYETSTAKEHYIF